MLAYRQSNCFQKLCGVFLLALVGTNALSHRASAADAPPKPAPGSAGEAVAQWAAAIDAGDIDKARSFIDQSKDGTFAHYVGEITSMRRLRIEMVARIRKSFGDAVAAKADALMRQRANGVLESSYGVGDAELPTVKEGTRFYPPGSKTECVVVRRDGKWLIDGSEVMSGGLFYVTLEEFGEHFKKLAAESQAALEAKTGDELLKTLAKINGVQ